MHQQVRAVESNAEEVAAPGATASPILSIVIPTRNEASNVEVLKKRLDGVLSNQTVELIFVDDSDDDTPNVVDQLEASEARPVFLIHRTKGGRTGGLGGAVKEGFKGARADWVCVMDADLQHPPEVVADLFGRTCPGDVDLVVASRFTEGGSADEFGAFRRSLSRISTVAAKGLFPKALRGISDPMSGFFMIRRQAIELDALKPKGFKILLELAARNPHLRKAEVSFSFGVRHSGESKASLREVIRYGRSLWALKFRSLSSTFGRFGIVGGSGLLVNTLLLALVVDVVGLWYIAGAVLATQGSSLWNYVLSEAWVFKNTRPKRSLAKRFFLFFAMNNAALVMRIPILFLFVSGLGANHLVANVASLLILTLIRFGLADSYIWASKDGPDRGFGYDLHGIITIESDVQLPELERFRTDAPLADPTIRVSIGRVGRRGTGVEQMHGDRKLIHYVEKFGNLGFGAEIELGSRIQIVATALLRHSPHVLYTNIVEPILRWSFVERGYALVHAACIASEGQAVLITARTDTGKTTTMLKTLDSLPYSFLSDDLTLLTPDGRVLTYPKPLTISRHTLSSVKTPLLTKKQRAGLIVQSRIHSKSGRLFGLIIAKTGLPAATMNALVQLLVPPPKFQVDKLVPNVVISPEAELAGMAIIQREGNEGAQSLTSKEALQILLSNCEDAYGFPPYPVIQEWLYSRNGTDLREVEHAIIKKALGEKPSQLLCSYDRNWYLMFPALVKEAIALCQPAVQKKTV